MTERNMIENLKKIKKKSSKQEKPSDKDIQSKIDLKKRWITYFRNNIEIFIEKRMKFHSFGYQNFSYHLMNEGDQYVEVSTRGVGKSLRVIVFAAARCLLYAGSKIGVTAVGASQANENFLTAFMNELVYKYSPFMKWLYENGFIKTKLTDKGYVAEFWNGSIIYFFPCINSSRGLHVDVLIGEEFRLIKKSDWDSIAMPMLVTRRAGFRSRPEYIDRVDLDEETKVICITSNRFKNEPFNTMFNNTFSNYFRETMTKNRVFCADIFLALEHGLKKYSWFLQQKEEMDEISFRTEILNESIGEVEGAYFTLDLFKKNQILKKAWYPPTYEEIFAGIDKNRKKSNEEYRFIFVDLSWVGDNNQNKNDNTVIGCASCYMKDGILIRKIEYLETHGGEKINDMPLRIKELFQWYYADYIIYDGRSAGELVFTQLSTPMEHPHLSSDTWDSRGLGLSIEKDLQMINNDRYNELMGKTVDKNFIPCIIPILANGDWNSTMFIDLKNRLKNSDIQLLIDELEFQTWFSSQKEWFNMTSEEKAKINMPYIQTILLINEAITLTQIWKEGKLTLTSPRTGKKDRIVVLGYLNSIATKLENKLLKNAQNDEFDVSQWKLVY